MDGPVQRTSYTHAYHTTRGVIKFSRLTSSGALRPDTRLPPLHSPAGQQHFRDFRKALTSHLVKLVDLRVILVTSDQQTKSQVGFWHHSGIPYTILFVCPYAWDKTREVGSISRSVGCIARLLVLQSNFVDTKFSRLHRDTQYVKNQTRLSSKPVCVQSVDVLYKSWQLSHSCSKRYTLIVNKQTNLIRHREQQENR
jgi:hypothetical protein